MKINKENYGRFIIEYYDGQLSPEEEQMLMLFLDRHPMLKKEFDSFEESPVLPDEPLTFPGKHSLKKPDIKTSGGITEDNYTEYFVLSQDNELTSEEQKYLKTFLQQNPHLQDEYGLFGLTKVTPDESLVFEQKELLKKRRAIPLLRYGWVAAAAVLLLFFAIRFFFSAPGQKTERRKLAIDNIPLKTMKIAVAEISPQIIHKEFTIPEKKTKSILKTTPDISQKAIEILASADIYDPLKQARDYAPLRFPTGKSQKETIALSYPVVVEQHARNNFLSNTIGKPFSQLAAVLALQKKQRKTAGTHDKGFVKVLQTGVDAMNALTDNDVVMVKTYNASGKLIDYQLLSDNFSISRPVKGGENR